MHTVARLGRRAVAIVGAVAIVVACGPSQGSTSPPSPLTTAPASPTASASATAGASASVSASATGTSAGAAFDPARVAVTAELVTDIPGNPVGIVTAGDESGRIFVVDKTGRIWIVRNGARGDRPFLDIASKVSKGSEQGLLGLAFHPDYATNGRLFIDYTDTNGDTVVSEWRVSGSSGDAADPGSERVVLTVDQPYANHNGGDVLFGPDGFLYITLGDGGSGGDPHGNGQKLDTLLGKILRIDVDKPSGDRAYGIPADNPFANRPGARPEIFTYGMRNPWRVTFDPANKDLWIADVGQNRFEEIDVVRAGSGGGQNFGWNRMEGFHCFPSGNDCSTDGLTMPVSEYGHDAGCSVTGGVVARAKGSPLDGGYVFSDYCSGTIWAIDASRDESRTPTVVGQSGASVSSFGVDDAGTIYVTDLAGRLLKLNAATR